MMSPKIKNLGHCLLSSQRYDLPTRCQCSVKTSLSRHNPPHTVGRSPSLTVWEVYELSTWWLSWRGFTLH